MSYEPDDPAIGVIVHRAPTQPLEVTDDELRRIGLVRGRMKGACEDKPGTLCYGFVFEEDPNGTEIGPAKGPGFVFTTDIDAVLSAVVPKLPPQLLIQMLREYKELAQRAGADPWLGSGDEWWARIKLINLELNKRGIYPYY